MEIGNYAIKIRQLGQELTRNNDIKTELTKLLSNLKVQSSEYRKKRSYIFLRDCFIQLLLTFFDLKVKYNYIFKQSS